MTLRLPLGHVYPQTSTVFSAGRPAPSAIDTQPAAAALAPRFNLVSGKAFWCPAF